MGTWHRVRTMFIAGLMPKKNLFNLFMLSMYSLHVYSHVLIWEPLNGSGSLKCWWCVFWLKTTNSVQTSPSMDGIRNQFVTEKDIISDGTAKVYREHFSTSLFTRKHNNIIYILSLGLLKVCDWDWFGEWWISIHWEWNVRERDEEPL